MAVAPSWLRDLAGAWVFYSVLPAWPRLQPGFQRIARFAPWIGLVIAALQIAVWLLLQGLGWPLLATMPVLIALEVWVTGGLHLDGVMDTADGLAAGASRRLEAMEDSRVGASGVQALARAAAANGCVVLPGRASPDGGALGVGRGGLFEPLLSSLGCGPFSLSKKGWNGWISPGGSGAGGRLDLRCS